jgi:hypothetical protein
MAVISDEWVSWAVPATALAERPPGTPALPGTGAARIPRE